MRSLDEWWRTIPPDLAHEARLNDEGKPSLIRLVILYCRYIYRAKMILSQAMKN
jgi:hypothetical protein